MKHLGVWILTAVLFAVIGGWCVWLFTRTQSGKEETGEATGKLAATAPAPVSHDQAGNVVVRFDAESQKRLGIQVQPLAAAWHQPELCAYGVLQEDPARSFALRAPLPGKVAAPETGAWPALGAVLPAGAVVGALQPRLGPTEQADLAARLAEAQANIDEVRAELAASRANYDSKKRLNVGQKVVSDQVLAEAEAAVKSHEAHLEASLATVKILSSLLTATTQPAGAIPLRLALGGTVVELPVQPGESVESGQVLLRVADFDRLIARVALPAGSVLDEKVTAARVAVAGHEDQYLPAERVSLAAATDGVTGGPTYLFSVQAQGFALQSGQPVRAYVQLPGEPQQGVTVPRSAIIRYLGRSWLYVQTAAEEFTRRELVAGVPLADGWFAVQGIKPGEQVVAVGAQNLLAEELRWQTTGTEEEE